MERSEEIAKLATALAKAQGAMEDAEKDSLNPHFQSRYASLSAVRHAIRKPLAENGLAFLQLPRANGKAVEVRTVLVHESGEFIAETLEVPVAQVTPQAIGSGLTYARRYALVSILGLASDENDDGEIAEGRPAPNGHANHRGQGRERIRPPRPQERRLLPPRVAKPRTSEPRLNGARTYIANAKADLLKASTKQEADAWWIGERENRESHGVLEGTEAFAELREAFRAHKRSLPASPP